MSFFVHRSSARLSQHSSRCLPQAGDPQYTHTLHALPGVCSACRTQASQHSAADAFLLLEPQPPLTTPPCSSVCGSTWHRSAHFAASASIVAPATFMISSRGGAGTGAHRVTPTSSAFARMCIWPGLVGGIGSSEMVLATASDASSATSAQMLPSCGLPSHVAGPVPR